MKHIVITITLCILYLSMPAQTQHPCAKEKIKAFQLAQKSNHKLIAGQENYDVQYVKLDLSVSNTSTEIQKGMALIKGITTAPSMDLFVLELLDEYTIDSAKINGSLASTSHSNNILNVFAPNSFTSGQSFALQVYYHGTVVPSGTFFGGIFNDYSPSWGAQVTWTLSEPFSANAWWPCKQDLEDKIDSCDIWLTVPNTLKAGSNGVLVNEVSLPNNKTRFEWKHRHPIDFYLLSFAVSTYTDYSYMAALPDGSQVLVQNYIYNNPNTLNNFQSEIDETGIMLFAFSDLYGIYPFKNEKYGHCMAPLGGGMEHQTMTTQGYFETLLTSHELGHQWFGDNVTCQTWGHIWVNEGFASYSEYLYLEYSNQGTPAQNMDYLHNHVMSIAGGSTYVYNQSDENAIFDSRLVYDKGSALVHMIRHWVNNDALFFQALKDYQNQFKNSTATAEDFIDVIETTTGTDMSLFLNHWYYGEGYPTYSGAYNNTSAGVVVRIDQTASTTVTPLFKSFLELKLNFTDGSDTTVRVLNTQNNQAFLFNISKEVNAVFIDPNNWVINKSNGFVLDEALEYTAIQSPEKNSFSLYPNPSDNYFTISGNFDNIDELQIIDNKGSLVFKQQHVQANNNILHNLPCGVYQVLLTSVAKQYVSSLVVR
ncbi:MAG: T9SS type A sorting domain-containing protein [Chitinophagales bacterium]|nr:T9SS type A sorting domain-containing protein [Chitinophagales bacterium]